MCSGEIASACERSKRLANGLQDHILLLERAFRRMEEAHTHRKR